MGSRKQIGYGRQSVLSIISCLFFGYIIYIKSFLNADSSSSPSSDPLPLQKFPIVISGFDVGSRITSRSLHNSSSEVKQIRKIITADPNCKSNLQKKQNHAAVAGNSSLSSKGPHLTELMNISIPEIRKKWVKKNWAKIKILKSDGVETGFSSRLKHFLEPEDAKCSQKFFLTWISDLQSFGLRENLCLQSIFKHHQKACVVILSNEFDTEQGYSILKPFLDLNYRILAIAPDLNYLFQSTPASDWLIGLKNGSIDPGRIALTQNLSNLLRLAALYKFGGIYLDTDVIVLKGLSNLSNAIGAQSQDRKTGQWNRINNAVMIFEKGHRAVYEFMQEFAGTFDGNIWGHNGPYLISRVLGRISEANCTVLPSSAFYPVSWRHMDGLFRRPDSQKFKNWQISKLQKLKDQSYAIHLWNRQSRSDGIEPGSIIQKLFVKNCIFCAADPDVGVRFLPSGSNCS